ncbi:hypothetical protein BDV18DRAFT_163009 [Aspergillus unguis]
MAFSSISPKPPNSSSRETVIEMPNFPDPAALPPPYSPGQVTETELPVYESDWDSRPSQQVPPAAAAARSRPRPRRTQTQTSTSTSTPARPSRRFCGIDAYCWYTMFIVLLFGGSLAAVLVGANLYVKRFRGT